MSNKEYPPQIKANKLVKELRMVSNMIHMQERIEFGRETQLMDQAAEMIEEARNLIAVLYCASGCDCCQDTDKFDESSNRLAEMFSIPKYTDGSGYDFYKVRDKYENKKG